MRIGKSLIAGISLMAATATLVPAAASAQESSYKPGTVWEAGRIDVLPGQFENYMDWLAGQVEERSMSSAKPKA